MEVIEDRTNTEKQAAVFAALADPTRLRLVKLLCRQCEPGALCVNMLARMLDVSQSAVSQHLRVLRAIGLVEAKRRGYRVHYFVNWDTLERCKDITMAALSADRAGRNKAERPNTSCFLQASQKER